MICSDPIFSVVHRVLTVVMHSSRFLNAADEWRRFRKARDAGIYIISELLGEAVKDGTTDFTTRVHVAHQPQQMPGFEDVASPFSQPFSLNPLDAQLPAFHRAPFA